MNTPKHRAWSWAKQGLDGSLAGASAAEVLGKTGWARSVGGANPYLGLFARAGIRREAVDADLQALHVHELPVVRGCTYLLGAEDFAWGLQLGKPAAEATVKILAKLGVEPAELDALIAAALQVLQAKGPLDPKQLKALLGEAVRNLGEAGKRKGASTTLPTALGVLQSDGRIRRVPLNGRLDQQRYAYAAWGLEPSGLSDALARSRMLQEYLAWTGGATLKQSQWFTSFTVAQTKAALAELDAVETDGQWQLPQDRAAFGDFRVPQDEQIQLLAGTDGIALLRRNAAELIDAADGDKSILGEKSLALQADLPDHPILDRGQIIGLWQYDPARAELVAWTFRTPSAAVKQRIAEVESYIREDLADFRSFSLDSPASRQKRIDALRAAAR
ncbi:MAG: winged helix DNA-binding domain-containing protein [Renibacterium sp.]|nr:winged helix DNA-binding domain-containing protein [Renibacterium sp.]